MGQPTALIDFAAPQAGLEPIRLAFGAPQEELVAHTAADVLRVLDTAEERARRGLWCVGYLRYEAASAFDEKFALHAPDGPLAYFSVHRAPIASPELDRDIDGALRWMSETRREQFDDSVRTVRAAIEAGEVYQVNYTGRLAADYAGDPFNLFCALQRSQPRSNAAFIAGNGEHILSVSPELFFDWDGQKITCAPMKGTAARGATPELDARNRRELQQSAKERAENVMIVDLIRNDLSRVAQSRSVNVTRLFECQAWPTVWQMVSQVVATSKPGTRLRDLFAALFPCGSITGAPKMRAMHWIRALESTPRGIYCGAVGVIRPGGAARFNVLIRTVTVRSGRAGCGIGSGITWGSTSDAEWSEWQHKSAFLEQASQPFELLQTLRVEAGQCRHLELHIKRLVAAGAHFGFPVDRAAIRQQVFRALHEASLPDARLRVLVDCRGRVQAEVSVLPDPPASVASVRLACGPVRASASFLRHKTTRREHFEHFQAGTAEVFDTLMWNTRGEVTEFTRGSVVIERANGKRVTPALHCGLLDGVGRVRALACDDVDAAVIKVDELAQARRMWFVNALRGWIEVRLELDRTAREQSAARLTSANMPAADAVGQI